MMKPLLPYWSAVLWLAACADVPAESLSGAVDPDPAAACYPAVRSCAERRLAAALDPSAEVVIDETFVRALVDECAGVHVTEPTVLFEEPRGRFRDDDSFTYTIDVRGAGVLRVRLEAPAGELGPVEGKFDVWHDTMLLETADCRTRLDASGAGECQAPVSGPSTYYVRVEGTANARYNLTVTLEPAPAAE